MFETIKEKKEKIKPCPFCGGKATIFQFPENTPEELALHPRWQWKWPNMFVIGCNSDTCIGDINHVHMLFLTAADAIEAWNKRAGEEEKNVRR